MTDKFYAITAHFTEGEIIVAQFYTCCTTAAVIVHGIAWIASAF